MSATAIAPLPVPTSATRSGGAPAGRGRGGEAAGRRPRSPRPRGAPSRGAGSARADPWRWPRRGTRGSRGCRRRARHARGGPRTPRMPRREPVGASTSGWASTPDAIHAQREAHQQLRVQAGRRRARGAEAVGGTADELGDGGGHAGHAAGSRMTTDRSADLRRHLHGRAVGRAIAPATDQQVARLVTDPQVAHRHRLQPVRQLRAQELQLPAVGVRADAEHRLREQEGRPRGPGLR